MDRVHGKSQCLVGLLGDRAIGHGTRLKTLYNFFYAFHLVDGNAFLWIIKLQKAPEIPGVLLIYKRSIFLECVIVVVPDCLLQKVDGLRIIAVMLALASEIMASDAFQGQIRSQSQRIKSRPVEFFYVCLDIFHRDAAHTTDGIGKIPFDHFFGDADGLKNLSPLIGLDGRDSHLGGNLYDAA